ncbi:zinc ABC transporter ATP-binding protein [Paenibacillus algicola]|uniref:Zinc ABC transporter ATP-binding protein n=1 Tax=Paenibacillus algicola TaxID=2565926 RepID=A0A4P8XKR3_9BACL|nr:metal ABC transporter ATP-binding protein [Paenibacillus algicola]QCT03008.1 zinc ABC transporter ATP-binding protein [Paenibacillus algicola]
MATIISMNNVEFGYEDVPCLEEVSVHIDEGEFIAVTGQNGAAKSTLLKLMLGLLRPWNGKVQLAKRKEDGTKLRIGYVSQQVAAFNSAFPSTVAEFVRSGRHVHGSWIRRLNTKDHEMVEDALKQMGMWELRQKRIGELSGGQKQKICIARALALEPDLLLLDEPTTGMDSESREDLYRCLQNQVVGQGRTVVMVTHALQEMEQYVHRIVKLERKEDRGWKCCTTTSCSGHFVPAASLQ